MVADAIFAGADRTPGKAALVYNGLILTYGDFARAIAGAQRAFGAQGLVGDGVAILAIGSLRDFWILSLALRRLGLTTINARSLADLSSIGLGEVRCVIAGAAERSAGLEAACAARGWPLISASADEPPAGHAYDPRSAAKPGGHILQTSGTTGVYRRVLIDPTFVAGSCAFAPRSGG